MFSINHYAICWWVLVLASWLAAAFPALKSELHNHPG